MINGAIYVGGTTALLREILTRSRRNKTGVTGVKQSNGYFVAYIGVGKKQKYLGRTSDFFEAVCLRKRAEKQYNYSPRHGL
ncbi:hypothetical protein IQR33_23085 [Vibrio sp. OPT46]|uniref:hypothetical protein n=1 Tax=Vibrio alginolyticus TaxID=663 RepID=UPI001882E669|nr:hypothetical protein [Vibrio sp. OPT46]